ncbi:MAG: NADH-quinone oxidoreductase subunit C [Chlorobiaceae bacterium]|nr:NADH-quinone oxidoreductase subunit C [Chlorobiaceae bacterium]
MKEKLLNKLNAVSKEAIESVEEFRNELTLVVKKEYLLQIAQILRDDSELQFDSLRDVCGAERFLPGDRFEVIYNLYSIQNTFRLRLKVHLPESDPHIPTVSSIWHAANFPERETYDMYGIIFDNHPDMRRIYMPEEFEYHPLRKDFPLMGIPGSIPLPRK